MLKDVSILKVNFNINAVRCHDAAVRGAGARNNNGKYSKHLISAPASLASSVTSRGLLILIQCKLGIYDLQGCRCPVSLLDSALLQHKH